MYKQVSSCPTCGAPIYIIDETTTNNTNPPVPIFTCNCRFSIQLQQPWSSLHYWNPVNPFIEYPKPFYPTPMEPYYPKQPGTADPFPIKQPGTGDILPPIEEWKIVI